MRTRSVPLIPLAAATLLVGLLPACSHHADRAPANAGLATGASGHPSPSPAATDAAGYADCMRAHGVPRFPDPGPNGKITVPKNLLSSPQAQAAKQACQPLLGGGSGGGSGALQQVLSRYLAFARCMRSHGIGNYPDPSLNGGGISTNLGPSSGVDRNTPQFASAERACSADLPGGAGALPGAGG